MREAGLQKRRGVSNGDTEAGGGWNLLQDDRPWNNLERTVQSKLDL